MAMARCSAPSRSPSSKRDDSIPHGGDGGQEPAVRLGPQRPHLVVAHREPAAVAQLQPKRRRDCDAVPPTPRRPATAGAASTRPRSSSATANCSRTSLPAQEHEQPAGQRVGDDLGVAALASDGECVERRAPGLDAAPLVVQQVERPHPHQPRPLGQVVARNEVERRVEQVGGLWVGHRRPAPEPARDRAASASRTYAPSARARRPAANAASWWRWDVTE